MYRESCGQTLNRLVRGIFVVELLVLLGNRLVAQATLAFSSGTGAKNGIATLDPALTGSRPLAVDWIGCTANTSIEVAKPMAAKGGVVTGGAVLPAIASLSRRRSALNSSDISPCAVTLTSTNSTLTALYRTRFWQPLLRLLSARRSPLATSAVPQMRTSAGWNP
jgi:hypothetical protein